MNYPETPIEPKLTELMLKMKENGLGPVDVTKSDLSYARAELQKQYDYLNQKPIEVSEIRTLTIKFKDESINVRIYFPESTNESTTFGIYLHGGGWTFGNEETHDGIARAFCKTSQLPIASIGYSLAPNKKFPFQNEQIAYLTHYLIEYFQNEYKCSGDAVKLILIGDSAGANLALCVYQDFLEQATRSKILGMILYYGVFGSDTSIDSWQRLGNGRYGLSIQAMEWYWNQYLTNIEEKKLPQTTPLLSNFSSLPPTLLIVGNLDPLLDDTYKLAEKLANLNTPHQVIVLEGYPHGFLRFCNHIDKVYENIQQSGVAMQQMSKGAFK